jgi:hypothetical protein
MNKLRRALMLTLYLILIITEMFFAIYHENPSSVVQTIFTSVAGSVDERCGRRCIIGCQDPESGHVASIWRSSCLSIHSGLFRLQVFSYGWFWDWSVVDSLGLYGANGHVTTGPWLKYQARSRQRQTSTPNKADNGRDDPNTRLGHSVRPPGSRANKEGRHPCEKHTRVKFRREFVTQILSSTRTNALTACAGLPR